MMYALVAYRVAFRILNMSLQRSDVTYHFLINIAPAHKILVCLWHSQLLLNRQVEGKFSLFSDARTCLLLLHSLF